MQQDNINRLVQVMSLCLEKQQPVYYRILRKGVRFNEGKKKIETKNQLAVFRAEVELAFGVEDDEETPE